MSTAWKLVFRIFQCIYLPQVARDIFVYYIKRGNFIDSNCQLASVKWSHRPSLVAIIVDSYNSYQKTGFRLSWETRPDINWATTTGFPSQLFRPTFLSERWESQNKPRHSGFSWLGKKRLGLIFQIPYSVSNGNLSDEFPVLDRNPCSNMNSANVISLIPTMNNWSSKISTHMVDQIGTF